MNPVTEQISFIRFIEERLNHPLPEGIYVMPLLENAVFETMRSPTKTLYLHQTQLYRGIFQRWNQNLSLIEFACRRNTPSGLPIFGFLTPLDFHEMMILKNLLVEVKMLNLFE